MRRRTFTRSITPELVDPLPRADDGQLFPSKLAAIDSGGSVIAEIITAIGQFPSSAAGQALIAALIQLLLSSAATPQPEFAAEPHYEIMASEVSKPAERRTNPNPIFGCRGRNAWGALRVYVVAAAASLRRH